MSFQIFDASLCEKIMIWKYPEWLGNLTEPYILYLTESYIQNIYHNVF